MTDELAETQQSNQIAVQQPDAMLAMIDKVCSDPNFDITKMEKLIEMRNAELGRVAEIDFNRAFSEMQPKLPRVISTHKNDQTNSSYSKIEDINSTVLPVISQYGFGVSFKVLSQDKEGVRVQAILRHTGGHKESTDLFMPYDKCGIKGTVNKTDIHATGSTITYAKRYAMCMLLDISTGSDNDGNNSNPQFITQQQVNEMNDLIEQTGIDKIKFISEYLKVDSLVKLPVANHGKAMNALKQKLKNPKEGNSNANS